MPNIAIPDDHADNPIGYAITHLAPERTGALYEFSKQVYMHSILPLREFEAARARVALINGCQVCQRFRSIDDVPTYLAGLGEDPDFGVHRNGEPPDEAFYAGIGDWRASGLYTERERLVLEYAERYSTEPDALGTDAAFWERLRAALSETEIYDLTLALGAFVAAGRLVHVLGFDQQATCEVRPALSAAPG